MFTCHQMTTQWDIKMNFWIADQSGKQCRCGSRQVGYDSGAAQVVFENQDLARDFAEFADVMSLLLNSRRAAAPQSGARSFSKPRFDGYSGAPFLDHLTAYRVKDSHDGAT
jgi:hypothetical protein